MHQNNAPDTMMRIVISGSCQLEIKFFFHFSMEYADSEHNIEQLF